MTIVFLEKESLTTLMEDSFVEASKENRYILF